MTGLAILVRFMLLTSLIGFIAPQASAQFNTSLTDSIYHQPWILHNQVLDQLPESQIQTLHDTTNGEMLRTLLYLETDAKYYENQVLEAINQLFGFPGFSEIARETSQNWSETLLRVDRNLKITYKQLGIQNDSSVLEVNASTQILIEALAKQQPFEKDVLNSLGRGVRALTVSMANRWWLGSEGLTTVVKKLKAPEIQRTE